MVQTTRYKYGEDSRLVRVVESKGANLDGNIDYTVPDERGEELLWAAVLYDTAPTHAGGSLTYESAFSGAMDFQLDTFAANAQRWFFNPAKAIPMEPGAVLRLVAPAGGGVINCRVIIMTREL